MSPTYCHGDRVLVHADVYSDLGPAVGDVVLARHPFRKDIVLLKRVAEITVDGRYRLLGDNAKASTDSRSWGAVPRSALIGPVLGAVE